MTTAILDPHSIGVGPLSVQEIHINQTEHFCYCRPALNTLERRVKPRDDEPQHPRKSWTAREAQEPRGTRDCQGPGPPMTIKPWEDGNVNSG